MIKNYENAFTNPRMSGWCVHNCVQEIQPLTYLKIRIEVDEKYRTITWRAGWSTTSTFSPGICTSTLLRFRSLHPWQVLL
jgi:hypothetical protein